MNGKEHTDVSTFTLDVYWASGRAGDPALEAHLAECARCKAYLDELDALAASARPVLPAAAPATAAIAPRGLRARFRGVALAAGGALALAAGVAIGVRGLPAKPDGYVGIKGTPAVQVLVHRDRDTGIWDGRSPVHPGDALALRVACEGLRHIAVAAPGPAGWTRLSNAECPSQSTPLPFTLLVDGEPGDERLAVVLSQDALDDQALGEAIQDTRRTREVWAVQFVLPKTTEVER
jgi:hypothetical protein